MTDGGGCGGGGGGGAFVRADQIDLKSLDEQLHRHLNRALTLEKKQQENGGKQKQDELREIPVRHGWEIDATKLVIKSVLARGTFGTVHRGVYDGQDVAGIFYLFIYL